MCIVTFSVLKKFYVRYHKEMESFLFCFNLITVIEGAPSQCSLSWLFVCRWLESKVRYSIFSIFDIAIETFLNGLERRKSTCSRGYQLL